MKEENVLPSVTVLTMGCRVNQFETDGILKNGLERGLRASPSLNEADIIVVNTCSVTVESERQARKLIRKLGRDHPHAQVVVTGCYAERSPEFFAGLPQVTLVVGNRDKDRLWQLWSRQRSDFMSMAPVTAINPADAAATDPLGHEFPGPGDVRHARASLQIQNGCDRNCTYCVIPRLRGRGTSLEPHRVLEQIRAILDQGRREIVLLGIDLGAYGRDLTPPLSLGGLMRMLQPLIEGRCRLRLSSIDPMDVDETLTSWFFPGSPVCPHLHLSIQSGDDLIRKRMGRHGTRSDILNTIERLRRINPDLIFGADLLAGFPTESDQAFANTLSLIDDGGLSMLHVFPYSQRPDTAAARFPSALQLPESVIKERARLLRLRGETLWTHLAQTRLSRCVDVLIEKLEPPWAHGTSEDYQSVSFTNFFNDPHGAIRRVRLVHHDPDQNQFIGVIPPFSTAFSTGSVDNF
ncbi:MAG: tRNA (N(6)-L-threonylcarbamoyladenosine(37)-C(2))-methylthiotransferase MtaB [Magnetococcales bacterium]|nr:tRNA (N(6)-L-threonylcarbamoyladenosine(37)-C(2))-methylthiotransferase MtaB [Magnetococcales bacterium]